MDTLIVRERVIHLSDLTLDSTAQNQIIHSSGGPQGSTIAPEPIT